MTIWTAYQNGVNPDGSPGKPGGLAHSTVVGYDRSGTIVQTVNVTGKLDGLTGDSEHCLLVATINEDSNSSLAIIRPEGGTVTTFSYSPSPTVSGNGGTDSIAIWHGAIYVTHSNPNDTSQPTQYRVTLDWPSHVAHLRPLFWDDSTAKDARTGATVPLALTDPDTSFVMPAASPKYAGSLATISQADGAIVFATTSRHHHARLTLLNVTDNRSENVPPIDGLAVATAAKGTLYVVDAKAGSIEALRTDGWPRGTVFVGEPNDNGNPLIGTLDLMTGTITPLGNRFVSPKGLLFLPEHHRDDGRGSHDGGHGGERVSHGLPSLATERPLASATIDSRLTRASNGGLPLQLGVGAERSLRTSASGPCGHQVPENPFCR